MSIFVQLDEFENTENRRYSTIYTHNLTRDAKGTHNFTIRITKEEEVKEDEEEDEKADEENAPKVYAEIVVSNGS